MTTQQQIEQLQQIDHNMNALMQQKQQIQSQLFEIDSALNELVKVEEAYRIVGGVMVKGKAKDFTEDFTSKKEVIKLRLKAIERQETQLREKAKELQEVVMKELKTNDTNTSA